METRAPPGLYLDPPSFDIELEEFGKLPMCRLEAFRLLRDGQRSERSEAQNTLTDDARLLLLHGHGDRPIEAKYHRADLASHFILKLACCGGSSRECGGGGGSNGQSGESSSGGNGGRDRRQEEADWRRGRREWFVRAEKDLFEARLHWHLRQAGGEHGVEESGARDTGRNGGAAGDPHASSSDRLEALRVIYDLGWLQSVEPAREVRESNDERACFSGDGRGGSVGAYGSGSGSAAGKRPLDGDDAFGEEAPSPSLGMLSRSGICHSSLERSSPTRVTKLRPLQSSATDSGSNIDWMSCPFEKVLPLVRSRRVLLRNGKALLSPVQVPEAVVLHFEERLREALRVAERGLPGVEVEDRVGEVLRKVRRAVDELVCGGRRHERNADNRSTVTITRKNIDELAAKHFPLCMRRTLRVLRREHHLKYKARLQFISFLLNAGMEVGELLDLWREEFPKGMPADEYARKRNQYEYSLRHLYGLEGKRRTYSSQSCARIADEGWGGSGEGGYGHGCPFHSHSKLPGGNVSGRESTAGGSRSCANDTSLRGMLVAQNLPAVDIEDIVAPLESRSGGAAPSSRGVHCDLGGGGALGGCRRHFSATHRWAVAGGGVWRTEGVGGQDASPNGWFAASARSSQQQEQRQPHERVEEFLTQQGQGV